MTLPERPEFFEVLQTVTAVFNRTKDLERLEDAYWRTLSDLPIDAVKHGLEVAARTCRWMPKPLEIREQAQKFLAQEALIRPKGQTCAVCEGGLWLPRYCPGVELTGGANTDHRPEGRCQRTQKHHPHTYVVPCECRGGRRTQPQTAHN